MEVGTDQSVKFTLHECLSQICGEQWAVKTCEILSEAGETVVASSCQIRCENVKKNIVGERFHLIFDQYEAKPNTFLQLVWCCSAAASCFNWRTNPVEEGGSQLILGPGKWQRETRTYSRYFHLWNICVRRINLLCKEKEKKRFSSLSLWLLRYQRIFAYSCQREEYPLTYLPLTRFPQQRPQAHVVTWAAIRGQVPESS